MKIVMLRESYLKRLSKVLQNQMGKVNLNVIGLIDTLRNVYRGVGVIQVERTQFNYPHDAKPRNGQCYAEKMCEDYKFLEEFPSISNWLGFPMQIILYTSEAMMNEMKMVPNSFVVLGTPPGPPKLLKTDHAQVCEEARI